MESILTTIVMLLLVYSVYLFKRNIDVHSFLCEVNNLAYQHEIMKIDSNAESEGVQDRFGKMSTFRYYGKMIFSFKKLTIENWFPDIAEQLNSIKIASKSK